MTVFLSTPSARRATCGLLAVAFIVLFLSTPSARRATRATNTGTRASPFLSTPSARRATTYKHVRKAATIISIHALCEEGDKEDAHDPTP